MCVIWTGSLSNNRRSQSDMNRSLSEWRIFHSCQVCQPLQRHNTPSFIKKCWLPRRCYFGGTSPAGAVLTLSWYFPQALKAEDIHCAFKMDVVKLVFLTCISIMFRPNHWDFTVIYPKNYLSCELYLFRKHTFGTFLSLEWHIHLRPGAWDGRVVDKTAVRNI